ncbi:hypothetical protein [Burkholderia sp. WSM2232]|uniref:hypothetical protein n=1 Tax=Burkholderia sp. WSM2232 TaxID=944436 RepID=UPI0004188DA5|nr:hypothetical protein [Burkholderia sp. WSM2232]
MYNDPDLPHVGADRDDAGLDLGTAQATDMTPRFGRLALCVAAASALAFGVVGTVAYGVWFNSDQQTYAEAIARARQALRMPAPNHTAAMLATSSEATSSSPATTAQTVPATAAATTGPLVMPAPGPLARSPAVATTSPADAIALLDLPAIPAQSSATTVDERRKPSTWSGEISRPQEEAVLADDAADAPSSVAVAPAIAPRAAQAAAGAAPAAMPQLASTRPAREAKSAQQERRASASSARRKGNLFTRMGSFFRRVSYRQHGSGSQQDLYSHP